MATRNKDRTGTMCDICGKQIPEGELATATTAGWIIDGGFVMDSESWLTVMCGVCNDKVDEAAGYLHNTQE
jgi:hypothetical protein